VDCQLFGLIKNEQKVAKKKECIVSQPIFHPILEAEKSKNG
jgi:hypothetical protein